MELKDGTRISEIIKLISPEKTKPGYVATLVNLGLHQGEADFYARKVLIETEKPWKDMNPGEKKASVILDGVRSKVFQLVKRNWQPILSQIEEL